MNMKQKTGKLLMAAIAAVLLFTSACGESQEETPPKTPENTLSNGAAPSESEEEGNGTYTETYDPEALFKFGMTPVKDKTTGKYGYKTFIIPPLLSKSGERISSTLIRSKLLSGEADSAAELLGYNYFIAGRVAKGQALGLSLIHI